MIAAIQNTPPILTNAPEKNSNSDTHKIISLCSEALKSDTETLASPQPLSTHKINQIAQKSKINPSLARYVAASAGIKYVKMRQNIPIKFLTTKYSIRTGIPTDQQSTGRCWIFSSLNRMRVPLLNTFGNDFNFSANYVAFWDKFERSNYIFEKMIEYSHLEPNDPWIVNLFEQLWGDGGDWELFVNIVENYGVVPDYAMPETSFSSNSDAYMKVLGMRVKTMAGALHKMAREQTPENLEEYKERALGEIYRILCYHLGEPPAEFKWKQSEGPLTNFTPHEFYKMLKSDVREKVHLTCLPYLKDNVNVNVLDISNRVGGLNLRSLNVALKDMKEAIRNSIKDGMPVDFSCEVCAHIDSEKKLLSLDNDESDSVFDFDSAFKLDKGDRLLYRVNKLSHMMVIVGCDEEDEKKVASTNNEKIPDYFGPLWKIENSWKDKQFYFMTDKWFDEYVYEAEVEAKYLPDNIKKLLTQKLETVTLPPWDPFGRIN